MLRRCSSLGCRLGRAPQFHRAGRAFHIRKESLYAESPLGSADVPADLGALGTVGATGDGRCRTATAGDRATQKNHERAETAPGCAGEGCTTEGCAAGRTKG